MSRVVTAAVTLGFHYRKTFFSLGFHCSLSMGSLTFHISAVAAMSAYRSLIPSFLMSLTTAQHRVCLYSFVMRAEILSSVKQLQTLCHARVPRLKAETVVQNIVKAAAASLSLGEEHVY